MNTIPLTLIYSAALHGIGWRPILYKHLKHTDPWVSGRASTVVGFDRDTSGTILPANSWAVSLVAMYDSTIATGQVVAYLRLSPKEMAK